MQGFGRRVVWSLVAVWAIVVNGCAQSENAGTAPQKAGEAKATPTKDGTSAKGHDHGDWWCAEHGVPESECSMCSAKAAAEFKKEGDWCEKHERAKSQCFICDSSLAAKYAARYEAKYGKQPPIAEENVAKEEK